jgi:hypothetical protein
MLMRMRMCLVWVVREFVFDRGEGGDDCLAKGEGAGSGEVDELGLVDDACCWREVEGQQGGEEVPRASRKLSPMMGGGEGEGKK